MHALTFLQRKLIALPDEFAGSAVCIGVLVVCLIISIMFSIPAIGFGNAMLFLLGVAIFLALFCVVVYMMIADDDTFVSQKADMVNAKISQLRSVAKRLKLKDDPVFMANIEANNIRRRCLERIADLMREIKETKAVLRGTRDEETKMFLKKAIAEKNAERDSLVARISNAQETAEYAVANGHVWPPNDGMFHDYF